VICHELGYFAGMRKSIFNLFVLLFPTLLFAQNAPYRSSSNQYYWKNRKPFEGYWQQDVEYQIRASVDDKTDIVDAEEELAYYNNSPDTLHFVYFHLYQNAFVKGGYLEHLNIANDFIQKFGKYEAAGKGTEIESIKVNGDNPVSVEFDFSIMKITLREPLLPNSQATFAIKFKTYFDADGNQRRRMKTFKDKWGNKQYDGVHWYPRICVYDRKFGWETDQHLGKEFYGDFGSYDVELTLPNQYILDATGVLQNTDEVLPADLRAKLDVKNFKDKPLDEKPSEVIVPNGSSRIWKFKSINTHDFAWVADPTFRIGESMATLSNGEQISCISLSQEPHSAKWQDAASFTAKVIEVYSRDIGNYAYPKMIVADARDGMEYPMLTLDGGLSPGYYGLLAHEVGHNWFFGMVGNNETYRASMDEGFTQFLTNWSMTSILGEVKTTKKTPYPVSRMDQTVYLGYLRDAIKQEDATLNTHSDDFNGALHHGGGYGHVYYKTATMLYNMQYVLGDSLFLKAMQHYFDQWKMAHPYYEDFRASIINYTHVDLNWFFDQWLETTKRTDYSIESVTKAKRYDTAFMNLRGGIDGENLYLNRIKEDRQSTLYKVKFKRNGEMQMPVDFTVYTKDSRQYNFTIPNTYYFKKDSGLTRLPMWKGWGKLNPEHTVVIAIPANSRIDNIVIDPTQRLADVYQLDNSSKLPYRFTFDKGRKLAMDRKRYVYEWRPDIWYNSIDGFKTGLHLEGNYMNYRHVFGATVWYNTTLAKDYSGSAKNDVDYNITYRNAVAKNLFVKGDLRRLDGLNLVRVGWDIQYGNSLIEIYYKAFNRSYDPSDLDYLLYNTEWGGNKNNTLNLEVTTSYKNVNGYGELKEGIRSTFYSDYDYSRIYFQWINHQNLAKLQLHSRVYAHGMTGTNIAPESRLYLAGANPEDMMENKFIRSRAFVPTDWLGYGADYNHFHAGGGLNIRGYAGYAVPKNVESTQARLYSGDNGASANVELDVDGLVPFSPGRIASYLHLDAYLFGDAGIIQRTLYAGEFGVSQKQDIESGLMASAGAGFALTIKKWGTRDKAKPLTLRFDIPAFLNNTPFADGEYLRFRWIVGVNRSF
jgi:hypothetical protein